MLTYNKRTLKLLRNVSRDHDLWKGMTNHKGTISFPEGHLGGQLYQLFLTAGTPRTGEKNKRNRGPGSEESYSSIKF